MEEPKPNSNRYKAELKAKEREKIGKIVTGKVITKKKNGFQRFADEFISEDAKNVKTYVFGEVLMPALKKAVFDIVTDGIDMILYGEARRGNKRSSADRVSYRNYYEDNRRSSISDRYSSYRKSSYDDIILSTKKEAEDVLDRMYEIIDSYGLVRVSDFYDLVGIRGDYTDNNYGWTNLRNADIVRVREGYIIKMPKAMPIEN